MSRKTKLPLAAMILLTGCSLAPLVKWRPELYQTKLVRTITVELIADEHYAVVNPDWKEDARKNIKNASDIFESNFGIKLFIKKYSECRLPMENHIEDFFALAESISSDADIKIIFSDQPFYRFEGENALAIAGSSKTMSKCVLIFDNNTIVIAHELGHVFGAKHSNDRNSIMRRGINGKYFDRENGKIIFRNKYSSFQ